MAGYIQNGSLPIPPISDTQASILDMILFPGFTRLSTAIQGYLAIDLSVYAPHLCFFGLFVFACRHICKSLCGWFQTYCTSTIHLHYREDPYDMLMLWISSQSFVQNTRSCLVTTDLATSLNHAKNNHSNDRDQKKRSLSYTPWNGSFFMWYKGCLIVFRRQFHAGDFRSREDVSISCFGRSSQILKELLSECNTEYSKLVHGKTCIYEHQDAAWIRSRVSPIRRISTVVLDKSKKKELLKDIGDFLNPTSRQWYSDRGIPYRRGYLLYGPPGTGKSSLSCAIAGFFGLDIYILNLSQLTEAGFKSLLAKLPQDCVLLLEDVDAASSNRDSETDRRRIATGSPPQARKSAFGNVCLSTLLNAIDGVASQEGRVLIMTTNHIKRLDEALIRPGRVDKKVELGLADSNMMADLFCLVFKPVEVDVAPLENAQSDAMVGVGKDRKICGSARSRKEEVVRTEQLAEEFARKVPALSFSTAEIYSFLLKHKKSPEQAINNVEELISNPSEARTKLPRISEDAQPETAREFKWDEQSSVTEVPTEMVQTPLASEQPTGPAGSPVQLPSKGIVSLSDAQELFKAVMDMQMTSGHASNFTCSHTPPEDLPETTSANQYSAAPYFKPTNQLSRQVVTTEYAQQFLDILKSLSTKQKPPPPPVAVKKVEFEGPKARASTLEFKEVNEVWDKKEYRYKVVESLVLADEVNELDHYVFVARTRLDKETKNQIQYVDIKSAGLRDILRKVLQDVQGVCLQEEKPSVEQNLLYHYLLDLEECRKNQSTALDRSTLEHLDLLLNFIRTAYASTIERLGPLLERHQITYDLLWTLFKPNTLTYAKCFGTGQPRCVKYEFGEEKTANGGVKYFHVKARYLDFDGKVFGETSSEHAIEKFRGATQITALEVFPLKYHPSERQVRAHLTECGRKFLSMMDVDLCDYKGRGFYIEKDRVVEIPVESRVVVDAAYFREENPNYARPSIKTSVKGSPAGWHVIDFDDAEEVSASAKNNGIDPSEVRGDDLLICSATVPGFSLDDRRWVEVAVANIKEIDWKQAALDDLHIPPRKKKAVQALSEAHVKQALAHSFDDVVVGKGQGFSVLLHGPPGVGKTLTAELIAEHLRRPLMPVSAGELGTTAEAVEMRLPRIFKRASRWKAILLLDEADVLLEQRSSHDIHRNALVCVFLRTLEYYQGMMFLTTNRVEQIDDAIASRIHFKLKYDKLNLEQRTNVWRYFLGTATTPQGAAIYSPDDFDTWARKERNGREIKNLVSTAQALAIQDGCQMTMPHLEVAIAASEDFECDFRGVGSTEAMNGYA